MGTGTGTGAAGFLGAHAAAKTPIATARINEREILVVIEWGWSSCCEVIAWSVPKAER
jgi:hypothetical protein